MVGPMETVLDESLKALKISQQRYWGGDTYVGNRLHLAYKSIKKVIILLQSVLRLIINYDHYQVY